MVAEPYHDEGSATGKTSSSSRPGRAAVCTSSCASLPFSSTAQSLNRVYSWGLAPSPMPLSWYAQGCLSRGEDTDYLHISRPVAWPKHRPQALDSPHKGACALASATAWHVINDITALASWVCDLPRSRPECTTEFAVQRFRVAHVDHGPSRLRLWWDCSICWRSRPWQAAGTLQQGM